MSLFYRFDDDVVRMCRENAAHAAAIGRKDLVQTWNLAALSANPNLNSNDGHVLEAPWASHPFGRKLIQSLLVTVMPFFISLSTNLALFPIESTTI